MQSKASERFVNIAPLTPPLSEHFCYISVIMRRQCCVLKPLQNPHCNFVAILRVYDWSIYTLDRKGTFHISSTSFKQDAYLTIVVNIVPVFLFKNRSHICIFNFNGKVTSNIELLKLWKKKSGKRFVLSLIIFTGISLSWQAFLLPRLWISAKTLFFVSKKTRTLGLYRPWNA